MPSDRPIITQARLKELLHYDPETGHFTWRMRVGARALAGQRAGCISNRGYVEIWIERRIYKAHRLAFLYMTGGFPPAETDHINRDRSDNRWANLRPATPLENSANKGLLRTNTSGYRGVTWFKPYQKWMARATIHGKSRFLGYFDAPEEASRVAEARRKEHHGEFYSCTPNPETLSPQPRTPIRYPDPRIQNREPGLHSKPSEFTVQGEGIVPAALTGDQPPA